jgi:hypothetical protein
MFGFQHESHEPGVELLQDDEPERGVAGWAASFEKLLGDAAGLHTFAVSSFQLFRSCIIDVWSLKVDTCTCNARSELNGISLVASFLHTS